MASVSNDGQGYRRLLYKGSGGKRRAIRLGKMKAAPADEIRVYVAKLEGAARTGQVIDEATRAWVDGLSEEFHAKLSAAGLIAKRKPPEATKLEAFLNGYIKSRTDVKPSTAIVYGHTKRELIEFFGAEKPLTDITPGDADNFRRHLTSRHADATARRRCGIAKQFFRSAVRSRIITENPFADMKGLGNKANRERDYFLSRSDTQKVLDSCPDAQWRLIVALARFGGLRTPSETLVLRWADVDWVKSRMTIRSPKTEHHTGGESREIPIFQELRPYLEAAFDPDEVFAVTRYRDASQNLRTTFEKIIRRAGLVPWEKLFTNLRASRATELAAEYPGHVGAAWLGHSEIIANRHYRQVTDADFERATTLCANSCAPPSKTVVEPSVTENSDPATWPDKIHLSTLQGIQCTPVQWAAQDSNL